MKKTPHYQSLIGVASYQLRANLPGELKGKLPTAKHLSAVVRASLGDKK